MTKYGYALAHNMFRTFEILVEPSMVMINIYLVSPFYPQEKRRRFFKKYIKFTLFTPKLYPLTWGVMKFIIVHLLTHHMLHSELVKIGSVLLEKMLKDDANRTTRDRNP